MRQTIRWLYWTLQNTDKIMEAGLHEAGLEEKDIAEYLETMRQEQPKWIDRLPALETVISHLGDVVSDLRATPDGFRGRSVMLKPADRR
jgi:hypothetical protein